MSAPVSPVCGRAAARLSIFTASTGPGAGTGSPVNGENNRGAPAGADPGGAPWPASTATRAAASPSPATAAEAPITRFRRRIRSRDPAGQGPG